MTDPLAKLAVARTYLVRECPFIAFIASEFRWTASEMEWLPANQRTMGVRLVAGEVECLFYPEFVDKLPVEQVALIIFHEVEHVLRLHNVRHQRRDARRWNIACDMAVNGHRAWPRICFQRAGHNPTLPLDGDAVWIPEDWPNEAAEEYYDRLCGVSGGGLRGNAKGPKADLTKLGRSIDCHSIWQMSDVGGTEAEAFVAGLARRAADAAPGHVPGHVQEMLARAARPSIDWRAALRRFVAARDVHCRRSYSRPNRRYPIFGLPGKVAQGIASLSIVLDTSGSVNPAQLAAFFGEIDALAVRSRRINLLQYDAGFQGFGPYRRGDWRQLAIRGRGGTDMAAALDWLVVNRKLADVQIMFTDGEVEAWPRPHAFPMVFAIANDHAHVERPSWGRVLYLPDWPVFQAIEESEGF